MDMARVPLMESQDDDHEQGLPSYEEAAVTRETEFRKTLDPQDLTGITVVVAFASLSIRLGFLRKVLGIISFQFLLTFVFCASVYATPQMRGFFQQQSWIVLICMIASFILLFVTYGYAKSVPLNYYLLTIWTLTQSVSISFVVSFYDARVVLEAIGLTATVVVCLFIYTLQSDRDFQKYWAILISFTIIFIIASGIQISLEWPFFDIIMAVIGSILFSIYLIFDIDRLICDCSPEDYIEACLSLYLDILNLFVRILQIVNELNRN